MKKIVLSMSLVLFSAFPSFAKPDIKIDLLSQKIVKENGKDVLKDSKEAKPGQVLLYTLKVMNKGDSAAKKLQPVANIPENTIYVPEKNTSKDYKVQFSLDGKEYSETPMVKVKENGKEVMKPATIDKYKKIKWLFNKDFAVKQTYNLTYKVKVK